jgi:hypothetical protein
MGTGRRHTGHTKTTGEMHKLWKRAERETLVV